MSCCGYEDTLSGASCTLEVDHLLPHRDLSDPMTEIRYSNITTLFVPESGTEAGEPDLLNFF